MTVPIPIRSALAHAAAASIILGSVLLWEGCGPREAGIRARGGSLPADTSSGSFAAEHAGFGFPLVGNHAALPCDACHGETEPGRDCGGCHRSPHGETLRRKCEDCHSPGMPFAENTFRHEAKGLFAFHQDVACRSCHGDLRFRAARRSCTSCHTDYHKGALERDCYECHRSSAWTETRFNHNATGFPLTGAHRALECGDCHRDLRSFRIVPRPSGCVSCHEADRRNAPFAHASYGAGTECQECHGQDSFSYAHSPAWFNVMTGTHAGISCATCHANSRDYREYSCHACHAGHEDDNGGRCLDCHAGGFPEGGDHDD